MIKAKTTIGGMVFDINNFLFLGIFSILCIYPFVYIFNISISENISAAQYGLNIIPKGVTFKYYAQILQTDTILTAYLNSIIRTALGTFLMLIFITIGAYPLSKRNFPYRRFWTVFILISMFFDGGLIPNFFLVQSLGLTNTVWALVLPRLVEPFYLLVMRNFMMSIPDSLEESAKIDGANDIKILVRIIIPLCKPILATVGLWAFVWHWNQYLDSLIYITDQSKQVLQVILFRIVNIGSSSTLINSLHKDVPYPEVVKACTIMITTLPILLVYPFAQKYFVKGILLGSVKG